MAVVSANCNLVNVSEGFENDRSNMHVQREQGLGCIRKRALDAIVEAIVVR